MRHFWILGLLATTVAGCSSPTQTLVDLGGPGGGDARITGIVRSMCQTLAEARSVRFESVETIDRLLNDGRLASYTTVYDVRVRKPDRMHAVDMTREYHMLYNGSQLVMHDASKGRYARVEAPDSLEKMFEFANETFDVTLPLAELLSEDPYSAIMDAADRGAYVGEHTADGETCHHLAFQQEDIDWQVWIRREEPMVPRQIVIVHKQLPMKPRFTAILKNWDLQVDLEDSLFEFTPQAGGLEVPMAELLRSWDAPR